MKRKFINIFMVLKLITVCQTLEKYKDCDFFQTMKPNVTYLISSRQYPKFYPSGISCRWAAEAPPAHNVLINCIEVKIPYSITCLNESIQISTSGRADLRDASIHCGTTSFSIKSKSTRMTMVLRSSEFSKGGKFKCSLNAVEVEDSSCNCGQLNNAKIVGGNETLINEYPSMAGLVDSTERRIVCGATIISATHALTAAHCGLGRRWSELAILVGEHDTTIGSESPYVKLHRLASFEFHEKFNEKNNLHDIALLRPRQSFLFSRGIQPACMPFRYQDEAFIGKSVTAVGWGSTEFSGSQSQVLRHVTLSIVSQGNCTSSQMCSYAPRKDTCQSDSGGPLYYVNNGVLYHVGIVSFGYACASNQPSVNTRVGAYLDWIREKTRSTNYCVR